MISNIDMVVVALAVPRHKVSSKEMKCEVMGCNEIAVRSVARMKASKALQNLSGSGRRIHLCKMHYKTYKKKTRAERKLETIRWE
jgi:hypothetical protein